MELLAACEPGRVNSSAVDWSNNRVQGPLPAAGGLFLRIRRIHVCGVDLPKYVNELACRMQRIKLQSSEHVCGTVDLPKDLRELMH
jgi:hypothetical protein